MQQILDFLIRYKNTILFLLLFSLSFFFTVQSHSYHKSKVIGSTNFLMGGIYTWTNNVDEYFNLKEYNSRLVEENKVLREQVAEMSAHEIDTIFKDTSSFADPYTFRAAKVLRNQYSKLDNYLLINKGKNDSIAEDYGVITSKGIVGIVEETSSNFSRIISILNTNAAINVQLKKSNHFGTLIWNGKNPNLVQLIDVPRLAPVKKGDTIITNGRSLIFPKGIPVGVIQDFELDQNESYYTIDIQLFNDMTNIGYVYIIENNNKKELQELLDKNE